jgi:hypothetical protein
MDATGGRSALDGVIESARQLGVELDAHEAAAWVAAIEVETSGGDVVVDVNSGIYGHRVTMLDFSAADLDRFRRIGEIVGFPDRLPDVRTALAISGSAAQSKIQSFPGDCDFFERIHITAPTREAACAILSREIREKALATQLGPTYRLWEVKFGSWPFDVVRDGKLLSKGSPVSWSPADVAAGTIGVVRDGEPLAFTWDDAAADPGWCKVDWIVADPARRALANASNVLDATWEGPDGKIVALDGHLDPYFQEVYLEADSLPIFTKIVQELSADSVDDYVEQLEHEVWKYTVRDPNFGKVARRLYNIFRLTGRYAEAAYLRELFDEPTTILYQVAALVRTIDDAGKPGSEFDVEMVLHQADELIMAAITALDGPAEAEMVAALTQVRESLAAGGDAGGRAANVSLVTGDALRTTNAYFERRLRAVPGIAAYLDEVVAKASAS